METTCHNANETVPGAIAEPPDELALFHFLLEHLPDRIYFKDRDSRFLCASMALAEFFGAGKGIDLVGKTDFEFFAKEHALAAFADEMRVMASGEAIVGKVEKEPMPDGRLGWAITTKMPLRNSEGVIIGTCGISKDFTSQKALEDALEETNERLASRQAELQRTLAELNKAHENLKAMQEQLLEAEKMQVAGRLAYGVAHEIRNPLNILSAGLDYLGTEAAIIEDVSNSLILDEMRSAVQRADVVIATLMESSAESQLKLTASSIEQVIKQALQPLSSELRARQIRVEMDLATHLPLVSLDQEKMIQVMQGIIGNALDAMAKGGELRIGAQVRKLGSDEVERDPGLRSAVRFRAGDEVLEVVVEDTGCGISQEALTKVFDPFFTTKETGSGTGMGLTVCRKIMQLHHGLVHVDNRTDRQGARVTVLLKCGEMKSMTHLPDTMSP